MSYNQYYNVVTNINTIWGLTRYAVNDIANSLYNDTFINNPQLLFNTPIENITSLRVYPFDVSRLGSYINEKVKIGRVNMEVYGKRMMTTQYEFIAYRGYITPKYNNFLDLSPYTKIEVYLPYVGFVDLNPDDIMGKELTIKYYIDVLTGKCMVEFTYKKDGVTHILNNIDGQIGVDIAIGGGGYAEIAQNLLMVGAGATTALLTGGATLPVLSGALISGINSSKLNIQKRSTLQPYLNFNLPQKIMIRIYRPQYKRPSDFASTFGLPLNETRKLNTLNGFTQVRELHIENIFGATLDEFNQIEALLKEGVILSATSKELKFKIDNIEYTFQNDMTWGMWTTSIYNTGGWLQGVDGEIYKTSDGGKIVVMGVNVFDRINTTTYQTEFVKDSITFMIDGTPYKAYINTSWVEWVTSEFNVNRWYIENNQIRRSILLGYEYISGSPASTLITPNDIIINNVDYETTEVLTEISFTIDSYPYITSIDTTWREWVNSSNNENSLYKIWGNKIYRMDNNIIRVVEGVGGIEVTPNDMIQSFDYTTGTLSTLTFTLYNLDSTTSTYTATKNTTWNEWLASPYSALKFTRINNFVCVLDSSLQPHKVLKDINAEPQTINDIVEATTYSIDSNIYT